MAKGRVVLHHPERGIKTTPVGFSWTVLVFGAWAPLFRGDIVWAIVMWVAFAIMGVIVESTYRSSETIGVLLSVAYVGARVLFAAKYNEICRAKLHSRGYVESARV